MTVGSKAVWIFWSRGDLRLLWFDSWELLSLLANSAIYGIVYGFLVHFRKKLGCLRWVLEDYFAILFRVSFWSYNTETQWNKRHKARRGLLLPHVLGSLWAVWFGRTVLLPIFICGLGFLPNHCCFIPQVIFVISLLKLGCYPTQVPSSRKKKV